VAATPELIRGVESQRWHDRPSPASTSALLFPGSRLAPGTLPSTPEERGPAPALSPVIEQRPTAPSDTAAEAASPRATSFSEGAAARAAASPENDERKLASSMDLLCSAVKSELLAEFAAARRQLKAQADSRLQAQAEEHARALEAARADGEAHRGLVGTLEANLAKKDAIIENLTEALSRERDKATQARRFHMWQVQLSDRKREHFATVLAERHAKLQAARKAFRGWRLVIENKWKARAERACQTRAQEVCHRLSQDYEGRVREVSLAAQPYLAASPHKQALPVACAHHAPLIF
jgi:centrosomal protein POC5